MDDNNVIKDFNNKTIGSQKGKDVVDNRGNLLGEIKENHNMVVDSAGVVIGYVDDLEYVYANNKINVIVEGVRITE